MEFYAWVENSLNNQINQNIYNSVFFDKIYIFSLNQA